jgi:hypothetical protein
VNFHFAGIFAWIGQLSKKKRSIYRLKLREKLERVSSNVGNHPTQFVGILKAFAFHCRSVYLGEKVNRDLLGQLLPKFVISHLLRMNDKLPFAQLSMIGRSLPVLDRKHQKDKAFLNYINIVLEPPKITGDAAKKIVLSYIDRLIKNEQFDPDMGKRFAWHSPGASYERSRKKGGYESALYELFKRHIPSSVRSLSKLIVEHISTNIDDLAMRKIREFRIGTSWSGRIGNTYRTEREFPIEKPNPDDEDLRPHSRLTIISEQGMKHRVVQSCDARSTFFGHLDRSKVVHVYQRVPQIKRGLSPELILPVGNGKMIFSSDLSNATDCLNRDIIDMVCQKLKISATSVYMKTFEYEGTEYTSQSGTYMGLPASWPVLSVVHSAIAEKAFGKNFTIRGDDLITDCDPWQIALYSKLMEQLGFRVNAKKSFKNPEIGLFCERFYNRTSYDGKISLIEDPRVISTRSFCKDPTLAVVAGSEYTELELPLRQWGETLTNWEASSTRKRSVVHYLCRKYRRSLIVLKDILFLPQVFGGWGWPEGPTVATPLMEAIASKFLTKLKPITFPVKGLSEADKASSNLRRFVEKHAYRYVTDDSPDPEMSLDISQTPASLYQNLDMILFCAGCSSSKLDEGKKISHLRTGSYLRNYLGRNISIRRLHGPTRPLSDLVDLANQYRRIFDPGAFDSFFVRGSGDLRKLFP